MTYEAAQLPQALIITQGITFDKTFVMRDKVTKLPIDLTGKTAKMQGRTDPNSPTTVFDLSTAAGTIILGGAAGTVRLLIPFTTTAAMDAVNVKGGGTDFQLITPGSPNIVEQLFFGPFYLRPSNTK